MSPEPFVSRAKASPAKRSEKGDEDENECSGFQMNVKSNHATAIAMLSDWLNPPSPESSTNAKKTKTDQTQAKEPEDSVYEIGSNAVLLKNSNLL